MVFLTAATHVWGQPVIPDPQGVYIDSEGVLRTRKEDKRGRLKELRNRIKAKKGPRDLVYVSLPRIFARARKAVEAGEPIPEKIRYLGGMVKLRYVFVYPEENDLVIAGPAEPVDANNLFRPLGKSTGRPVLQLDDLVVALRVAGPGKSPRRIGCDIEVTPEIAERVKAKIREVAPKAQSMGVRNAADEVAKAGGKQPVTYYSLPKDCRFAFVCVEADYVLKHLALGLFRSPVRRLKSYNELIRKPERAHRFSLETHYDAIVVSPRHDAFELTGPSLKVNTGLLQRLGRQKGKPSRAARRFVDGCNRYWDELSRHILSWSDLANLSDLSVLAAIIGKEELHKKAAWDLSWVLDPKGYPVAEVKCPRYAHRLANYSYAGNMLLFTSGGVWIGPMDWADRMSEDKDGRLKRPVHPQHDVWIETPRGK